MSEHKIVNEFKMNGKSVITLDSVQSVDEFGARKMLIGDKLYSFELTHNDYMYVVDTTESLFGKSVRFTWNMTQ